MIYFEGIASHPMHSALLLLQFKLEMTLEHFECLQVTFVSMRT